MALQDWNWRLPVELQDVPWDCAAASVTWCLNSIGRETSERAVVESMYPDYLSPTYGLLDASGAGMVEWLASVGVTAENNPYASWDDIVAAAGHQPLIMGGRAWYHWSGVRISSASLDADIAPQIALANPSPGWMGVSQQMTPAQFDQLGPWSAVWFTAW